MTVNTDQEFPTALLHALLKEGEAVVSRGLAMTSTQVQAWAVAAEKFVVIQAKPLAARLYMRDPGGPEHEYYRETADQLPDQLVELVRSFITSGMKELSVEERREISRRIEQDGLGLGILIDGDRSTVLGLALPRGGGLPASDELFRLVWLDEAPASPA